MNSSEVCQVIVATLSPEANARRTAEAYLKKLESEPGFGVLLLQLVQEHSTREVAESGLIRSAAAVYFKNLVKRGWDVSQESGKKLEEREAIHISDHDREAIKQHMVTLVCECGRHSAVMKQLSAALSIISASDFPSKWPNLLPEIVDRLSNSLELRVLYGMLTTANSIMKRFRYAYKSDALYTELKYVLDSFAAPLTATLAKLSDMLTRAQTADEVKQLLECLRLVARIFFSLNWQDIPEFFEDHMPEWMGRFEHFLEGPEKHQAELGRPLALIFSSTDTADDGDDEGPIEALQSAIVENIALYASKYEEEFLPYLQKFAAAVWQRLMRTTRQKKYDHLAVTSIGFLASVVGNGVHAAQFADEATLKNIIESIVAPNLQLRDSDLEQFEDNPREFVSRDLEAADAETRRRSARELVQSMCKHHEAKTTQLCVAHASQLLASANWRDKDAFFQLVTALTVRAETQRAGATRTSTAVDLPQIFAQHVRPELLKATDTIEQQTSSHPILLADAIQFVCTFRNQLPGLGELVPVLATHCRSRHVVVHTYAAYALERLIHSHKVERPHLEPHLTQLFEALFAVIDAPDSPTVAWENEYSVKAVMRLLLVADAAVAPAAQLITDKLVKALARVCGNPRNPKFNHYLFESLAVLVRVVCRGSPQANAANKQNGTQLLLPSAEADAAASKFEALLFPPFQSVLQMDVAEFAPYVFQILALLLGFKREVSPAYAALLPPLLHPTLWEHRGNVPALAQLLEAYLRVGARLVIDEGHLEPYLGVFQKLLASKQSEPHAFHLLTALVLSLPAERIDAYLPTVFRLLLTRLQHNRDRTSLVHHFTAIIGLIAGKRGPPFFIQSLESAGGQGVAANVLQHVVIPSLISAPVFLEQRDAKHAAVGLVRLLTEQPDACFSGPSQAWTNAAAAILGLLKANAKAAQGLLVFGPLAPIENGAAAGDDHFVGNVPGADYDAAFSQLAFGATTARPDAFATDVPDLGGYIQSALTNLAASRPDFNQALQAAQSHPAAHPNLEDSARG